MSRLFAFLSLSIFLVGCEALWEDDETLGAEPAVVTSSAPESVPVAVSSPAVEPVKVVSQEVVSAPEVQSESKFSWEAPATTAVAVIAPVIEAPKDPAKVRITEIRESLGLVAFVRSEAPAVKSLLQLIKEGKVLVVEVVSVKGTQVVANILPGQKNAAQLSEADVVDVSSYGSARNK